VESQRAGAQPLHPIPVVDQQQVGLASRLGLDQILGGGQAIPQQPFAEQTEFLRRENVVAQVQVVARMIDQLEGQHAGWLGASSLDRVRTAVL